MFEFLLLKHPNDVGFLSGFDKQSHLRREKGRYFVSLNPQNPVDVSEFFALLRESCLEFNGHSSKQLAAFDPAFDSEEGRALLAELRNLTAEIPKFTGAAQEAAADAELMQTIVNESIDLEKSDALAAELRSKRDAAESARIKAGVAQRRFEAFRKKLVELILNRRKAAGAELKKRLAAAAEQFNRSIASDYAMFWSVAKDLFPAIAELSSTSYPPTPPGVYRETWVMNFNDVRELTTLHSCPQIEIGEHVFSFAMKPVKNA